jgi:SOS-response transcriptional repressor LexA
MDDKTDADYQGAETTGFQSPAQDHIEHVLDLPDILDLRRPGMYPVRVIGQAFRDRGIHHGDILIANAAADPAPGMVVIAFVNGMVLLATLKRKGEEWLLLPAKGDPLPLADDAEVWATVSALVRLKV